MHFEVPKAATFKEFGGEYLMTINTNLKAMQEHVEAGASPSNPAH